MGTAAGRRPRVLILGAGVAGLTLAALLRQRGESPVIVERAPSVADTGYMLGLYPLGGRVLHGLGLHDCYLDRSVPMQRYEVRDGRGRILRDYDLGPLTRRFGPIRGIARGALIDVLLQGVDEASVRTGTTATALIPREDGVEVQLSDGTRAHFDLVVAADGLHSDARAMLFEDREVERRDTGWGGWVYWADADPDAPGRRVASRYVEYWGAGFFVGLYPVRDRLGVFVGGPVPRVKARGLAAFVADVQSRLDPSPAALEQVPVRDEATFFWAFEDVRAAGWTRGRVVLLGDAAVGFLPTAGVGASMAMESAAVLADELARCGAGDVERGLALFEARRRRRVEGMQDASRGLARWMFVAAPPLAWVRDRLLRFYTLERLVAGIAKVMDAPI